MEDAQSETQRKRVWEWYRGTAYNRLMPNGAIVIIGHRMHDADFQGGSWPSRRPVVTVGRLSSCRRFRPRARLCGPSGIRLIGWSASSATRSLGSGRRTISRTGSGRG